MIDLSAAEQDEAVRQLRERRRIWGEKYAIRACYRNWMNLLRPWAAGGKTLEVGAGAGLMKELWGPGLVATDILPTPWIDYPMDALNMTPDDGSFDNVLCIDALHHFPDPHRFIDEAARVVRIGGRLLFVEPWISPLSRIFYGLLHHERIHFGDYKHPDDARSDPWAGNLAMPNLVFGRQKGLWTSRHPEWRRLHQKRFSMLDFQVAGGFKPWSLTKSERAYDACLKIDRWLSWAMPLLAFRVIAVFERVPASAR